MIPIPVANDSGFDFEGGCGVFVTIQVTAPATTLEPIDSTAPTKGDSDDSSNLWMVALITAALAATALGLWLAFAKRRKSHDAADGTTT